MEGVVFLESPFGYWYNMLGHDWQANVLSLQDELRAANKSIDVFVWRTMAATGDAITYFTPCDRAYRPPMWQALQ